MSSTYTEDYLVEQPAIQLMQHELGWDVMNCYDEWVGGSSLGREGKREVVLTGRLKSALQRLNPELPTEAVDGALEEISRDRTALSLVEANREIDKLLRQGVKVEFPDRERGGQRADAAVWPALGRLGRRLGDHRAGGWPAGFCGCRRRG